MLKNYLKIALRNLLKRKGYSLINILALGTGMAVCLLIVLFVQSELGYDKHHERGDQIYRIALERLYPGRSTSYAIIPQSIGEAAKKEFPEVLESTRLFNFGGNGNFFFRVDDKVFEEERVYAVDSNFFRVFSGHFLQGNAATALMQPASVVLNETTAKKIWGSAEAAMGKQFKTDGDNNNTNTFLITGVCRDWPANSHFDFNVLIAASSFPPLRDPNYINFAAHTYLLLQPQASPKAVEAKFGQLIQKYVSGEIGRNFGQTYEQFVASGNGYRYYLQPLHKIHLHSDLEAELGTNGSAKAVSIFSVIAMFILFLACINFVNLSTAQSVERAKEVGIRKTFGSERGAIIRQFLVESVMISLFALLVAFLLMLLLLPLFNQLSGKDLTIGYFMKPLWLLLLLLFATAVGIIAGMYPAFVLSSFKPITVLKGKFKSNRFGLALRNGLVVFQFAISVILIVATLIVNQQMRYVLGDKLGFRKDQIITIERTDVLQQQTEAFKTELARLPGVEGITGASTMPGAQNFFGLTFQPKGSKEPMTGRGIVVDEAFASVLGLELKEGRFFSKAFSTDSLSLVLNEKAVKELNLTNPIGARLTTHDEFLNAPDGSPYEYTVVGVLKDFHFQSLHQQIAPLVFINTAKFGGGAALTGVRVKSQGLKETLNAIEATWKKFVQGQPFHYTFLDQTLANQYRAEQTAQKIFTVFSSLAIFIACIGLLGLVAYTTHQRTKEISIRKVLGASAGNIVNMLSKDFLKLVLIASLIAFPVAWWGMHTWLQDFAYRINISGWIFVVAAGIAVLIALLTVAFQAIKAALANPVKNLRTE